MKIVLLIVHTLWIVGVTHYIGLVLLKHTAHPRGTIQIKMLTWPIWILWFGIQGLGTIIATAKSKVGHKFDQNLF